MLTSAGQQRVMHAQGVGTASHKHNSRDVIHEFSLSERNPITDGLPVVL